MCMIKSSYCRRLVPAYLQKGVALMRRAWFGWDGRGLGGMGVFFVGWACFGWDGRGAPGSFEWTPGIDQRMLHLLENMDRIPSDQSL